MRVTINGENARDRREQASMRLLGELDYEGTHFAIAVNYDVLPRSRWAETQLKAATRSKSSRRCREGENGRLRSHKFHCHRPT